jgi:hypothetical protein
MLRRDYITCSIIRKGRDGRGRDGCFQGKLLPPQTCLLVQVTGSAVPTGALRNGAPFKGWDRPPAIGLRRKVTLCSLTRIMSRPGLGTPDLRHQHDGRYLCSDRLICNVQSCLSG